MKWFAAVIGVLALAAGCGGNVETRDAGKDVGRDLAGADAPMSEADAGDVAGPASDVAPDANLDTPVEQPGSEPDAVATDAADAAGDDGAAGTDGGSHVPAACITAAGGAGGAGGAPPPPACDGTTGDFDGDGIVDCAKLVPGSNSSKQSVEFHKGLPTNAYATAGVTTPDGLSCCGGQKILMTYDLNHDGRMDIITSGNGGAGPTVFLYLLAGKEDGTFSPSLGAAMGDSITPSSGAADFDGDGHADLLLVSYSGAPYRPHLNVLKASATGALTVAWSDVPNFVRGLFQWRAAADVNLDGKVDLIGQFDRDPLGTFLGVSLNDGSGHFTTTAIAGADGAGTVEVRDFDGDGKPDLIVDLATGFPAPPVDHVPFLGDGMGHFAPPPPVNATPYCGSGDYLTAPPGDFDGDGLPDCAYVTLDQGPGMIGIAFHQGVVFQRYRAETVVTKTIPIPAGVTPFMAVDLNGDHRADLLLRYRDPTTKRYGTMLLRGNADGTFATPSNPPPATSTASFRPGGGIVNDFNGDGRNDVFMVGVRPDAPPLGNVCLATMSVTGPSVDVSIDEDCSTIVNAGSASALAVTDVNNDGKLDGIFEVLTSPGPGMFTDLARLAVALGDGTGKFTLSSSSGTRGVAATTGFVSAVPVDCNGDGKIDLAVSKTDAALNPKPTAILFGDGAGGFAP